MPRRLLSLLLPTVFAVAACGTEDVPPGENGTLPKSSLGNPHNAELAPGFVCPGAPQCPKSDDAELFAAAEMQVVTPAIPEKLTKSVSGKPWEYHELGGDEFSDANGNGKFDATWMAGFGTGRPASGVADEQYVRALVLKQGKTTIAFVTVDAIGFMYDETLRIREALEKNKVPLSYVFVGSSHVHEARDTLGIWGVDDASSGLDRNYNASIRDAAVKTVTAAVGKLERVTATFGSIEVDGHLAGTDPLGNGVKAFVSDGRDPVVIDTKMNTMRLVKASDKTTTVATVVNWAAHPETAGSRNTLLSSDYVNTLRKGVEQGVDAAPLKKPGLGGVCLFLQGQLGGQIGPGQIVIADPAGTVWSRDADTNEKLVNASYVLGTHYAYYALTSLESGNGATSYETVRLGVRARQLYAHVDNRIYHVALVSKYFDRAVYHFDESKPIGGDNTPDLLSEIAIIDVGPATMITAPGELFPESSLGGYDGSHTPKAYDLTRTNPARCGIVGYRSCNKAPPDLTKAPKDGFFFDLVTKNDPKAKYKWLLGLGNDMIGYMPPSYDFILDPSDPYYAEPKDGDHYEETNSIGPLVEHDVLIPMQELLKTKVPIVRPD